MNLSTNYLGLQLANPLIVGASPFCDNVHVARQLQDHGAAALVMRSLFEEQIDAEQRALLHHVEGSAESFSEATSFFQGYSEYQLTPDRYLKQIGQLKKALTIPVIASLNGSRPGGWTDYAKRFEAAGADAVELNLYQLATDPEVAGDQIEADMIETVSSVVRSVKIPVAVKMSPFHTSVANFAVGLQGAGAKGLVIFNRFYQPDIELEDLEVRPHLKLSDPSELLLRLRWLAILSPRVTCSLSVSGGVHGGADILKALLTGADSVQLVSVLLRNGPRIIGTLLESVTGWLVEHGYENLSQLRGAMNLKRCPDPAAFERANYIRILQSWQV